MHVLVATASPRGLAPIDADGEVRVIAAELRVTIGAARLSVCPAATLHDLHRALLARPAPTIAHLIGHGATSGTARALVFATDGLDHHEVGSDGLAGVLAMFRDQLELVVFSACDGAELARRASHATGRCAIGFAGDVCPAAARTAMAALYRGLMAGEQIVRAAGHAAVVTAAHFPSGPALMCYVAGERVHADDSFAPHRSRASRTPAAIPEVARSPREDDITAPDPVGMDDVGAALSRGEVVVVAGQGISAEAGLPDWLALLRALIARARKLGRASVAELAEVEASVASGRIVDALDALRGDRLLGRNEFGAAVEALWCDRSRPVSPAARALAALAPGLRAVVTTCLDHALARAFGGGWPELTRPTGDAGQRTRCIIKLHGTLSDRRTWVLSRDDQRRALYREPELRGLISALHRASTLLFVGYRPADPDFELLFSLLASMGDDASPPRHFALMASRDLAPLRERVLRDAGLCVIPYHSASDDAYALSRALERLAEVSAGGTRVTATG